MLPTLTRADLRGVARGHAPPNFAPNKFQERPSVASRVQENLLAASAPPYPWLVRRRLAAPPEEPHPTLGPLGFDPDPK